MISSSVSGNHSNNITCINNNNIITVAGNYSLNPTSSNIIHNNGDSNKYPNQKVYITNNNSSSNYAQKANKNFTINEQYNENSKQQEGKKQSRKPPSSSTNITKNKKKQDFEILHFRANITRKDGNKVMKKRKHQPKFHYCYFKPENISQEVTTTNGISSTNNNNNKKLKSNKEKRIVEDDRENLSKNLEKTEQLFNTQNGTDLLTSYDDLVNPTLKILNCNVFKTTSYTYYLNYISFGFPIIPKHALEQNFFNEEAMEGKYENDVLALLYSIHAMVCQVVTGQIEQCDDAFKKAIILMDEFSCSCKSVACAGCFCFISIHFLTKGNSEFARKCLERVDEFLCSRNENYRTGQYIGYNMQLETELNTNYSIYFDLPEDILHLTKFRIICGIAFDDHSLLCYDYNNHKLSYSSNLFFEKFGIQFYNQKSLVSKLLSNMYLYSIGKLPCEIIRIVSQPLTKESVLLYTTLLEVLKNNLASHDNNLMNNEIKIQLMKMQNVFASLSNALILIEYGESDESIEEAINTCINNHFALPDYSFHISSINVYFLTLAASIHISQYRRKIEKISNFIELGIIRQHYVSYFEKDIFLLNNVLKKYPILLKSKQHLLEELETLQMQILM